MSCFSWDTPVELTKNSDNQTLLHLYRKYYATENEVQTRMLMLQEDVSDSGQNEPDISYWTTISDSNYAKATWVGVATMSFAQLTGINAIMFYASQIFANSGTSPFTANGIIGAVNCGAVLLNFTVLIYAGKRPTLIFAQIICSLSMLGFWFTLNYDW